MQPNADRTLDKDAARKKLMQELRVAGAERVWYIADAFRFGMTLDEIFALTHIHPRFLAQLEELVLIEAEIVKSKKRVPSAVRLREWKRKGFSDRRLAQLLATSEEKLRKPRHKPKGRPMSMAPPTDFICVVSVASALGNFSKVKRGNLVTT